MAAGIGRRSLYSRGIIHGNAAACLPQLPYQVLERANPLSFGSGARSLWAKGLSKFGTDFLGSFQARVPCALLCTFPHSYLPLKALVLPSEILRDRLQLMGSCAAMAARCRISPSLTLLEFCLAASSASVGTTTSRQGAQQSPAKCSPFCAQSTMRGRSVPGWQTEPTWCSSRPVPEPKAFRLRFSVPAEVRRPQAGHLRRISASHGGPEPRATNGRAPFGG